MKRAVKCSFLVLALAVVLLLGACGSGMGRKEKSVYEQGLSVISLMAEMAKSDGYAELYSSDPELKEFLSAAGGGSYDEPQGVYGIQISESTISGVMQIAGAGEMSDTLKEYVTSRAQATVATQINAAGGASMIAASSVCTAGKTFVNKELKENTVYLYTFESGTPVMVSFLVGEDGAVSASGSFIFSEDFKTDTEEDMEQFFSEFGVEVERIETK